MILPTSFYRRIADLEGRLDQLSVRISDRAVLESGIMDRKFARLPEGERLEVLRLLEQAFGSDGMLDSSRLTDDERTYLYEQMLSCFGRS